MRHLTIKDFGPIQEANLNLGIINIITGLQSSGKSCVLKTACYCAWVEKRLELAQKVNGFWKDTTFIDQMAEYYKMEGYLHDDTYIEYETDHLKFSYDHHARLFSMDWKQERWDFKRPKISYIPADRNLVAAIPGWSSLSLDGNMIDFMSDWDKARRFIKREENFLNLGMTYTYDSSSNSDSIRLDNGHPLTLTASSSGIQSLVPMYVHLDYLTNGQFEDKNAKISYERKEERKSLLSTIYELLNQEEGKPQEVVTVDGVDYGFRDSRKAVLFRETFQRYVYVDHSEIFLEEPEDNLFPPTQCQFVNWLLESSCKHGDMVFIATHSPYILNQIIKQDPEGLNVFFTCPTEEGSRMYSVRQLKDDEVREIYDNGIDLFFNFELYV